MNDTELLKKITRLLDFAELKLADHDNYDKLRVLITQDLEEVVDRIEGTLTIMLQETNSDY